LRRWKKLDDFATMVENLGPGFEALGHAVERDFVFEAGNGAHCHAATDLRSFWSPGSQRDGEDQLRWTPVPAGDH
jgi:hypothetical protein